jgi:hypothetical protein
MHTLNFDPRQRLLIGLVALMATLVLAMVAASPVGQLDLGLDRGSGRAAPAPAAESASAPTGISSETPRWITNPLAPPLESLARPAEG